MSYKKELKAQYRAKTRRMTELISLMNERKLTTREREEFSDLKRDCDSIDAKLATLDVPDLRGVMPGKGGRKSEPRGTEGELLSPKQSVRDWHRANENRHNEKRYGSEFDMDALFRQMSHMEPAG